MTKTVYPILPLRDIVIFPHMIAPLFVGRIKSIKAIRSVTESEVPPSGFNVDDNSYSKKITLTSAEPVVVFFGRSDKAGRSYLRIDGKQKIYEVAFVLDDLVTDPELWLVPESQQNQNDSELK